MEPDLKFLGRLDQLSTLKRRVLDLKEGYRQNIALMGSQYVGKTSLIHHFLMNLDDADVTPIYLDLDHKDFEYFLNKFIGSLLYNFSINKRLPVHEDFSLLLETTKTLIPQTVQVIEKIRHSFTKGKTHEAFLGLIALPEIFTNESKQYCVLILDEFQNLESFAIPNIFQTLGKKIMTQKRCLYIVSSSYHDAAQKILTEKLSLLFGNFESITIDPFDFSTCQQFIEDSLIPNKVGAQLRNFLTDFTGGYPLYLSLICKEISNLSAIHKQAEVYLPILSQAVENTLFDRWGVISRHFELMMNDIHLGKGHRAIVSILISIANGKNKLTEILKDTDLKKNQLMQKLNRLMEKGIIIKNGGFYYFQDKLFKYWVKYVYQKRIKDVDLTFDKQKKQFKEEFNNYVESFKVTSRKDFSSRIIELLSCFDNEALHLNGRKYQLPIFKEITPLKIKDENGFLVDVIKASTVKTTWFIVMKNENFAENDVSAILSEIKKMQAKPEKFLLISLNQLDENTRLKALQERFWIWNEAELNTLLTLFDKPYIIK